MEFYKNYISMIQKSILEKFIKVLLYILILYKNEMMFINLEISTQSITMTLKIHYTKYHDYRTMLIRMTATHLLIWCTTSLYNEEWPLKVWISLKSVLYRHGHSYKSQNIFKTYLLGIGAAKNTMSCFFISRFPIFYISFSPSHFTIFYFTLQYYKNARVTEICSLHK